MVQKNKIKDFEEIKKISDTLIISGSVSGKWFLHELKSFKDRIYSYNIKAAECIAKGNTYLDLEWITDNFYLIESQLKTAQSVLADSKDFAIVDFGGEKMPASYICAGLMLNLCDYRLSEDTIKNGLNYFNEGFELSSGELSLFSYILCIVLLEKISSLCDSSECIIREYKKEPDDIVGCQREHIKVANELSNAINSLRFLSTLSYYEIFEEVCPVERVLRSDPAGIYPQMTTESKGAYRLIVEQHAKKEKIPQSKAAQYFIDTAKEKKEHVGEYILNSKYVKKEKLRLKKEYIAFYIAFIFLAFFTLIFFTRNALFSVLMLIPAFEGAKEWAGYFFSKRIKKYPLPALDFSKTTREIPKTMVVICALLTSENKPEELYQKLERFYLANRESQAFFGLLCDFKEEKNIDVDSEEKLIKASAEALVQLNQKYENHPFCLFVRRRMYNRQERKYMGWERKRGAIEDLVSLIKGEDHTFCIARCDHVRLADVKYILTLDEDSGLTMESVDKMVGVLEHPVNRPVIDPYKKVVVKGYGILQPRIESDLESTDRTLFAALFGGQGGIDGYGGRAVDINQDLLGEGIFCGKGLIDVNAYHQCLKSQIRENIILSHDIIEGAYIGCCYYPETVITDGVPAYMHGWFERFSRWTRGDFQNILYLFSRIKNAKGKKIENPIGKVSRFHIFDNMLRSQKSTAFICSLFVLFFGRIAYLPYAILVYFLLLFTPVIVRMAQRKTVVFYRTFSFFSNGIFAGLLCEILNFLVMPYVALIAFCSAVLSLYRLIVTKKGLLLWTTAAQSGTKNKVSLLHYYKIMWPCVVFAVLLLFSSYPVMKIILFVLWILGPAAAYYTCRPTKKQKKLSQGQKEELKSWGELIFRYFKEFSNQENNFLPPDNVQFEPASAVAHRTSPTNIGLCLLCFVAGYDLGFIELADAKEKIRNTLGTIDHLKKWNGHLYNWYDTKTLDVLRPEYVSTVDSGNLVASFIALLPFLQKNDMEQEAKKVQDFIDHCDFRILYNERKHLFYIGKSFDRDDDNCYDLLASEARITSYIALAKGVVPKKHWLRLQRPMSRKNGYMGLFSWTGTMFEYFMPAIFLPVYKNSLLAESLHYCIARQKEKTAGARKVWGTSESAFYSFDPSLNYQYKAFGVQDLGLKNGLDNELVISPYSSYLGMIFDEEGAFLNLLRLKKDGCFGPYGHFEAVDYTKIRTGINEGQNIRAYMAHHLGMSLLSIANTLCQNIVQRRFMQSQEMMCAQEFLCEKLPDRPLTVKGQTRHDQTEIRRELKEPYFKEITRCDPFDPSMMVIGSSHMAEVLCDNGTGFLSCNGKLISKKGFAPDGPDGLFAFLTDSKTNMVMPLSYAPFYEEKIQYKTNFSSYGVNFISEYGDLKCIMNSQCGGGEPFMVRGFEVKNSSDINRELNLCLYFEPVLAKEEDYVAHMAFSKLFLEFEYIEKLNALVIKRRGRDEVKKDFYTVVIPWGVFSVMEVETRREKVLKNGLKAGLFVNDCKICKNPVDPCVYIKSRFEIKAKETLSGGFIIASGEDLSKVMVKACRYCSDEGVENCREMTSLRSFAEDELLLISNAAKEKIFQMLPYIFGIKNMRKVQKEKGIKNTLNKKGLWPFSISGDLPILLFDNKKQEDIEKAEVLFKAHRLFFLKGILCDLVILLDDGGDYLKPKYNRTEAFLCAYNLEGAKGGFGGVHIIDSGSISEEEKNLLYYAASYLLEEKNGEEKNIAKKLYFPILAEDTNKKIPELSFDNGYGGFLGYAYCIYKEPPRPFSLVMGNGRAGGLINSFGGGYTFCQNARENKITPYLNDPFDTKNEEFILVENEQGEEGLLRGNVWVFDRGCAKNEGEYNQISYTIWDFFPRVFPIRIRFLTLKNHSGDTKKIKLRYVTRVINDVYWNKMPLIVNFDHDLRLLWAQNPMNNDFYREKTFVASNLPISEYTGSYDDVCAKQYNAQSTGLIKRCGLCIGTEITLDPGERAEAVFLLGQYENEIQKKQILKRFLKPDEVKAELLSVQNEQFSFLDGIQIHTPDQKLDILFNRWLPYQTYTSRMKNRTAFYQCGGAYGFRDQLQDSLAFLYTAPELTKIQIVRAATHQFAEGDVLHWWHPIKEEKGYLHRGIRTHHSDSHLWLPFAVCEYVEKTNDTAFLKKIVPYIKGDPLKEDERERYQVWEVSDVKESLYDHCKRAIEYSFAFGENGLCLIKRGDWNDGLNLVGAGFKGESVWLSQFLYLVLRKFMKICEGAGDHQTLERYQKTVADLKKQIEEKGWDERWYLRGFWDDGEPLGAAGDNECEIDSLTQSFSVLSNDGQLTDRQKQALRSAYEKLVDENHQAVRLFWPPFLGEGKNPGYISAYPPGVRENGGQYTHAAIWLAAAFLKAGQNEKGYQILSMINPVNHTDTKEKQDIYKVEPYVIAADVYTYKENAGMGGWTWYTGAAGWYYRVVIEYLLGLDLKGDRLFVNPCMPQEWENVCVEYRFQDSLYKIFLKNQWEVIEIDQKGTEKKYIPLLNDQKEHIVHLK